MKTIDELSATFGLEWISRREFTIGEYRFEVPRSLNALIMKQPELNEDIFYMGKPPDILRRYFQVFSETKPKRILEIGLLKGGSAAFLQLSLKPKRMLAIELSPERLPILDNFIENEGLQGKMHLEYGVDQGDVPRVRELCATHLGEGRMIDLVIDDASHMLGPTRRSFEAVFPYIRPGGSYIIEDYATIPIFLNPWLDKAAQDENYEKLVRESMEMFLEPDNRPLHAIAMEVILGAVADRGIISSVVADRDWLRIVRGSEEVEDPENFSLRDMAQDHFGLTRNDVVDELKPYLLK